MRALKEMNGSGSGMSYLALTSAFSPIFESSPSVEGAGGGTAIEAARTRWGQFQDIKEV